MVEKANAWSELINFLEPGEAIEAIVFGAWGSGDLDDDPLKTSFGEPNPPPVPLNLRKTLLYPEQAKSFMSGWSFETRRQQTYAVNLWTNQRVIWVDHYDGSTALKSMPRNPSVEEPEMSGGG